MHRFAVLTVWSFVSAIFVIIALPGAAFQSAKEMNAASVFELGFNGKTERLSGKVDAGTSITDTIRQIGRTAGFEVRLQPGLGELDYPVNLDGLTIEDALRSLVRDQSYVVFRGLAHGGSEGISKIWVMAEGGEFDIEIGQTAPISGSNQNDFQSEKPYLKVTRAIAVRDIVKLSNIADEESINTLRKLAVDASDAAIRRSALSALAGIAGEESHNLFEFSGLKDPDVLVRIEAARSLLRVDHHRGPAIVEAAAQRETDQSAREIMERMAKGESVQRVTGMSDVQLKH
ncbi:hypothetical protein SAMN05444414_1379 [Roseovarius marisflavi]|uniref:HEAT repeat-containing protein n=2 Tax=Roseovarius marisflavi TaxID=1054996 RepID=A0A1M7D9T0_9RHOB|nr:hypothetical protein SAMN05444414_1379 [Roseovarius marisflavi]